MGNMNQSNIIDKIKVLIVDDSMTTAAHLRFLIDRDEQMVVCGTVHEGQKALDQVKILGPDVIVMDLNMPGMNGYSVTEEILKEVAVPIIICSATWEPGEVAKTFRAIEVGAVTAIPKPPGVGHKDFAKHADDFVTTVKLMSEVRVVRRRSQSKHKLTGQQFKKRQEERIEVIGIGASTGGPLVLQQIFEKIPADYPIPIVVIQHIANGFVDGMVVWLQECCDLELKIAGNGEALKPGVIYFPPDDCHLEILDGVILLDSKSPKVLGLRPAIGNTFRSLAQNYGPRSLGILLTGMGTDGAEAIKLMHDKSAVTIAQDKESCAVFGMPATAISLGGVSRIMNPDEIREFILQVGSKRTLEGLSATPTPIENKELS